MKKSFLYAAGVVALLSASPSFAQAYSGGNGTFTGLGADTTAYPGTTFDQVGLIGATGIYGGPGTYNFNLVTFLAGLNRNDAGTFTGSLTGLTGTFAGNPFTYSVDYSISIANSDTITLGGNSFVVGGTYVKINPLTLTSAGEAATGTLTVSVPEPATWGLMIVGFGMMGFGMRYRKRSTAKVTFA